MMTTEEFKKRCRLLNERYEDTKYRNSLTEMEKLRLAAEKQLYHSIYIDNYNQYVKSQEDYNRHCKEFGTTVVTGLSSLEWNDDATEDYYSYLKIENSSNIKKEMIRELIKEMNLITQ